MELRKFIKTTIREYLNEQQNIGNSKLITNGKPNIYYHGTDEIFDYPKYINSGREIGFHLGNLEQALNIKNKIKNNYPKYINKYEIIDLNPLRMKDLKFWLPEYIADEIIKKGFNVEQSGKGMWGSKFYKPEDVLEALKSEGFDSIIYKNEFEGDGDSIIVFDNAKIKFLGREKIKQKDYNKETLNENRFEKRDEEQYKSCLMSDLMRMEIIDMFFDEVNDNPEYNIEEPSYFKLIDNWDGYDDQVYIQNNLIENEFIFWEGWVDECWKGLYFKPEYKGLNKIESINKVIKERFPRIGEEFGYKIKDFNYFKHRGKFVMKVVFSK